MWIDAHIVDLARQLRLSYLPPLLVFDPGSIFLVIMITRNKSDWGLFLSAKMLNTHRKKSAGFTILP
jgi:hypothetical protein